MKLRFTPIQRQFKLIYQRRLILESNDQVYYKLQKHLDSQPVGFPATKSGSEIRILKHIFSPREAEITSHLSYKFESARDIFIKTQAIVKDVAALETILQRVMKNGGIEIKTINGVQHYRCVPLVIGMYEFQQQRLTMEFIENFNEYTSDRAFGVEFLSTKLPQVRTIPIQKSLQPVYDAATYDEISCLLDESDGPFTIFECICRKKMALEGNPCKVTERKETCLGIGEMGQVLAGKDSGRSISKDEAITIIEENQKEGLVLQPSNAKEIDFVCSCCGCCCGLLNIHKNLPKPLNFWATNYYAVIDADTCKGCGICESKCHVDAITVSKQYEYVIVDNERCIGCGVCISSCATNSISLEKKPKQTEPPRNRGELLDIIMENKKGKFGKMLLTGRLIYDAIRTGQSHLIK